MQDSKLEKLDHSLEKKLSNHCAWNYQTRKQVNMLAHPTDTRELSGVVEALRDQLTKSRGERATNRGRKSPPAPNSADLEDQVLALLNLLDEQAVAATAGDPAATERLDSPMSPSVPEPAGEALFSERLASEVVETLERSLAQWQAQVMLAYSQGAAQELNEQLRATIQLNETLQQRETRLESQRQSLEQLSADLLQQQARTQRQRRSIGLMLRAQKAEMLSDIERQRQQNAEQLRQQQLSDDSQSTAAASQQTQQIAELQQALQAAHSELANARQDWQAALAELESNQLDAQGLRDALNDAQQELQQTHDTLSSTQQNLQETAQLLQDLELSQSTQSAQSIEAEQVRERLADLQRQLATANQELEDLKQQNFDLASQVAKHQVVTSGHTPHVSFDSSTLSWEERKKLIMRQLEQDNHDDELATEPEQTARRLQIEDVVRATQMEIEQRDAQIAELQTIVEQQSDTRQGVAIGAAAFAQAFESDEIIQQERLKLKEMQLQWEQKLRQAEIDVSLERAKLARERTQLEYELEETKREKATLPSDPANSKKRKWLEHLGLRDESRGEG